jgi:hypothetical protein
MNLIALLDRSRRLPLDARYAALLEAKKHFKPRSIDAEHLQREIKRVQFRRLRRDLRKTAA